VTLRGDTDFSQTAHLDRWHHDRVRFVFGYDARANLVDMADALPEAVWLPLMRRPGAPIRTVPRQRPANVKATVIRARAFRQLTLDAEAVAAFPYRPTGCRETYRMVVLRKNISVEQVRIAPSIN
jgi:hypothetical protein